MFRTRGWAVQGAHSAKTHKRCGPANYTDLLSIAKPRRGIFYSYCPPGGQGGTPAPDRFSCGCQTDREKSSFSSENTVFLRNLDFCISKSSKGEKRRGGRFPGKNKRTRAGERARGSVGEQPKERKARCSSGGESPDLAAVNIKTPSSGSGAPIKPLLRPGTELRIRIRVRK